MLMTSGGLITVSGQAQWDIKLSQNNPQPINPVLRRIYSPLSVSGECLKMIKAKDNGYKKA